MSEYFENLDNYENNDKLMNPVFLGSFNQFYDNLQFEKHFLFRHLKLVLKNVYFVTTREQSFDLVLKEDYSNLIQFLANLELEKTMQDLLKEFIGQKNMFFFNIKQIRENFNDLTTTIINIYDVIERMHSIMKDETQKDTSVTIKDLQNYQYILGVLMDLKNQYSQLEGIMDKYNLSVDALEESVENFDESLETMKMYYHKRYVEGIIEDSPITENEEGESIPNEDEDQEDEQEELEDETQRDPIAICDSMLMSNYGIEGNEEAFEVPQFEEIEQCTNIKNSCCEREEFDKLFQKFNNENLLIAKKKYLALNKMIFFIISNFHNFQKHSYTIYRLKEKDAVCQLASKNVIFTPINQDFVNKIRDFMNRAHLFSLNSMNGIYCSLCDYDFHKTLQDEVKIKLTKGFCDKMVGETFDFASVYNLQLIDYFNNLIQILQCDTETGEKRDETHLNFESNKEIVNVLVDCDEKNKENCYSYCYNYFFTKFNSIYDVDFMKIYELFKFIKNKMEFSKMKIENKVINEEQAKVIFQDLLFEKNDNSVKSIDSIVREIIEEDDEKDGLTGHNPYEEGADIFDISKEFDY